MLVHISNHALWQIKFPSFASTHDTLLEAGRTDSYSGPAEHIEVMMRVCDAQGNRNGLS